MNIVNVIINTTKINLKYCQLDNVKLQLNLTGFEKENKERKKMEKEIGWLIHLFDIVGVHDA